MTYHQITFAERYTLGLLRQGGLAPAAIGRVLGRHRSTIGREVRRNGTPRDGCYRPQLAEWYAGGRRSRSRRNRRFTAVDWTRIQTLLRVDWSPEQVAGRLRLERALAISHETIYRYIWADKRAGGTLYQHLRGARKQRRKRYGRYGRYDSRGRLAGKRSISTRPAAVETRRALGHWEADTMLGIPCGPSPSITAPNSTTMSGSSGRPRPASTLPHRITPGNAAPTKTPMASCANISPSARAWPTSPNPIAIGSRRNSTADRGSGSVIEPRRNAMRGETRCCTSKLISNSPIGFSGETLPIRER